MGHIDGSPRQQLLVQWKGCPLEEASWMDYVDFINQFPFFSLEDKAVLREGCSDRSRTNGLISNMGHDQQPLRVSYREKLKGKGVTELEREAGRVQNIPAVVNDRKGARALQEILWYQS